MNFRFTRVLAAVVGAAATMTPLHHARAQAAPTAVDLLVKAKNSLSSLKYHEADSLARRAMGMTPKLAPDQQVVALQIRAAALYPEEANEQHQDSAVTIIKQLLLMNVKTVPKDISWPGLDGLIAGLSLTSTPGRIWLGSTAANAMLLIDDAPQGPISRGHTMNITSGQQVKISVRADKCPAWDTTLVVRADSTVRIGYRPASCTP